MHTKKNIQLKVLFGILSITLIGGFTTHVLDVNPFSNTQAEQSSQATQKMSIIGYVSDISSNSLTLTDATASDKTNNSSYTISLSQVETIETGEYDALSLSSIQLGDHIIVQGTTNNSDYFATRIILLTKREIEVQEEQIETPEEPTAEEEIIEPVEEEQTTETPTEEPTTEPEPTQGEVSTEEPQIETPTEETSSTTEEQTSITETPEPEPTPIEESQTEPVLPEPTPEEPAQEESTTPELTPELPEEPVSSEPIQEEPQETPTQESEPLSTEPLTE